MWDFLILIKTNQKTKKPTILFVFRYFQRPAKQTTYFLFGTYLMDVNPEVWNLESLKNTKTAEFNQNFPKKQKIKNWINNGKKVRIFFFFFFPKVWSDESFHSILVFQQKDLSHVDGLFANSKLHPMAARKLKKKKKNQCRQPRAEI